MCNSLGFIEHFSLCGPNIPEKLLRLTRQAADPLSARPPEGPQPELASDSGCWFLPVYPTTANSLRLTPGYTLSQFHWFHSLEYLESWLLVTHIYTPTRVICWTDQHITSNTYSLSAYSNSCQGAPHMSPHGWAFPGPENTSEKHHPRCVQWVLNEWLPSFRNQTCNWLLELLVTD